MGNAKSAMLEDARAKEWGERTWGSCIVCERGRRIGVGIGKRLECFVCTEAVTCNTPLVLGIEHT